MAQLGTTVIARITAFGLAALLSAAVSAEPAARVYKTTDENGNVVFTDDPRGREAEAVELRETMTFSTEPTEAAPQSGPPPRPQDLRAQETPPAPVIALASPAPEETIRSNDGSLLVVARIDGELRVGDALEVLIDGAALARNSTGRFALSGIDRGAHRVQVRLVNADGETERCTAEQTFYLHQAFRRAP